ncbi:MAG: FAD-binding oxidoreductase, partial [Laribacter sp.]|nr:FAD-binding oxidoreductase [Laribacter sp.]
QQGLRRNMLKVFPHLADVRIDHCWGGLVDISRSRAPHLGRFAAGRAFYMQGFSGHGVALSGLAGRVIAEAVQGKDRRLAVFERLRHADFPGGRLLRRPALMAGMCAFRLRDWLPG